MRKWLELLLAFTTSNITTELLFCGVGWPLFCLITPKTLWFTLIIIVSTNLVYNSTYHVPAMVYTKLMTFGKLEEDGKSLKLNVIAQVSQYNRWKCCPYILPYTSIQRYPESSINFLPRISIIIKRRLCLPFSESRH